MGQFSVLALNSALFLSDTVPLPASLPLQFLPSCFFFLLFGMAKEGQLPFVKEVRTSFCQRGSLEPPFVKGVLGKSSGLPLVKGGLKKAKKHVCLSHRLRVHTLFPTQHSPWTTPSLLKIWGKNYNPTTIPNFGGKTKSQKNQNLGGKNQIPKQTKFGG